MRTMGGWGTEAKMGRTGVLQFMKSLAPDDLKTKVKGFFSCKYQLYDPIFKLNTKAMPILLTVMLGLSLGSQLKTTWDIKCKAVRPPTSSSSYSSSSHNNQPEVDQELNDYCWEFETFLIKKYLAPEWKGRVIYPGIAEFDPKRDEVYSQYYYKQLWLYISGLAFIAYLPHNLWKVPGYKKLETILEFGQDEKKPHNLVYGFIEMSGSNGQFAMWYTGCKILSTIAPLLQGILAVFCLGPPFQYYGYDCVLYFLGYGPQWPNPMDILFPNMAKCNSYSYGFGGDRETRSAICQLPLNNVNRWSFFVYWWFLFILIILSLFSLLYFGAMMFPCIRHDQYRRYIQINAKCELDIARTYRSIDKKGREVIKECSPGLVIKVNMSFGDWLLLDLLAKNVSEFTFRGFIRELIVTRNAVLQLVPKREAYVPWANFACNKIIGDRNGWWFWPTKRYLWADPERDVRGIADQILEIKPPTKYDPNTRLSSVGARAGGGKGKKNIVTKITSLTEGAGTYFPTKKVYTDEFQRKTEEICEEDWDN